MNQNKIITFIYIEVINEFARPEDCHKFSRFVPSSWRATP